jgi:hypothetical protein
MPPLWFWIVLGVGVVGVVVVVLLVVLRTRQRKPVGKVRPCPNCGRMMEPDWERCAFCGKARPVIASIEFLAGPLVGQVIKISEEVTTIGSAPGNTIVIDEAAVSRKHAGFRRVEGGIDLADLGSTNGIYVNGERVPRKRLAHGDVVRIGQSEIVVKIER